MPVTIKHSKSNTIADYTGNVTVGNSSGGTALVAASDLVLPSDWNSSHLITLSLTASDVNAFFTGINGISMGSNANSISFGLDRVTFFEPYIMAASSGFAVAQGSWYVEPLQLPFAISGGRINLFQSHQTVSSSVFGCGAATFGTASTGSASKYFTQYNRVAIFSQDAGANSTRLASVWSGENSFIASQYFEVSRITSHTSNLTTVSISATHKWYVEFVDKWDVNGGTTRSTFSGSTVTGTNVSSISTTKITDANFNSGVWGMLTGPTMVPIGFPSSLAAGQYWIAFMRSSTSSQVTAGGGYTGGVMWGQMTVPSMSLPIMSVYRELGETVATSVSQHVMFNGVYTALSSCPATMGNTDIKKLATDVRMYWNYIADEMG
jgi:hypothetical protein